MSGAAISGYLAQPEGRVPLFGDITIFQDKPYTLPGLFIFGLAVLEIVAVMIWVPEVSLSISLYTESLLQTNVRNIGENLDNRENSITYRTLLETPAFRSILAVNIGELFDISICVWLSCD
jgi:hypothetical protein